MGGSNHLNTMLKMAEHERRGKTYRRERVLTGEGITCVLIVRELLAGADGWSGARSERWRKGYEGGVLGVLFITFRSSSFFPPQDLILCRGDLGGGGTGVLFYGSESGKKDLHGSLPTSRTGDSYSY